MNGAARRFDLVFPLAYAAVYVAVALAVQLAFFPIGDIGVETDFYGDLVIAAQHLYDGDFSVHYYPYKGPLTSFLLVTLYPVVKLFGGDWYRAGLILNMICAVGFLVLNYRLLLRVFNRRTAVFATVGLSLAFEFFLHAHKASSDLLFLLLCYLAVEALTRDGWSPRRLAAAGALGGLAFLTRYNGLIVPLAGVIVILFVNRERRTWRGRLAGAALHVAAFVVVAAPWYAANYAETGRMLATNNLQNIFVEEFYGVAGEGPAPAERPDSLAGVIRRNPVQFLRTYLVNVPDHLRRDLSDSLNDHVTLLFALGLLRLLLFPPRRRHAAFLVFPLFYFLAMCSVYYQPRFAFSVWPAYFALGFAALTGFGDERRGRLGDTLAAAFATPLVRLRARRDDIRARVPWAGTLIVVVVALVIYGRQISDLVLVEKAYRLRCPTFVLDVAPELKRLAGGDADAVVLARKPHLAYYAGLRHRSYPRDLSTASDFLRHALANDARFIIYSGIERNHFPEHLFLGELARHDGVDVAYGDEYATIYELKKGLAVGEVSTNAEVAVLERNLAEAQASGDAGRVFELCTWLARAVLLDGDWQAAAGYLERGVEAMPHGDTPERRRALAEAWLNLGQSYLKLERHAEGVALFDEHLAEIEALLPVDRQATAHASLACHHEYLGDIDKALRHLARARDLFLSGGDVQRAANIGNHMEFLRGNRS